MKPADLNELESSRSSLQHTEINNQWENIVREQTSKKKNNIRDDISLRETSYADFVKSRIVKGSSYGNSKNYLRNRRADNRQVLQMSSKASVLNLSMFIENDPIKKLEKKQINAILKIELFIVMLKSKSLHMNVVSDFEQIR